jgi:hypothetical protein
MSATIIPWPVRHPAEADIEDGDYRRLEAWARVRTLLASARPAEPSATDEILAILRRIEGAITGTQTAYPQVVLSPDQRVTRMLMPSSSDRRPA